MFLDITTALTPRARHVITCVPVTPDNTFTAELYDYERISEQRLENQPLALAQVTREPVRELLESKEVREWAQHIDEFNRGDRVSLRFSLLGKRYSSS